MERIEINCLNEPDLVLDIRETLLKKQSAYQEIAIHDTWQFGKCLFLDGVIQSAETDHKQYDRVVMKQLKSDDSALLILGGGDGHAAEMALELNPDIHITVVELDREVVRSCQQYLNQKIFSHSHVKLIIGDAIDYLENTGSDLFDGLICDLTDQPVGVSDSSMIDFYTHLLALSSHMLSPPAWITIYGGCNEEIVDDIIQSADNTSIQKAPITIESFGESCYLLHAQID